MDYQSPGKYLKIRPKSRFSLRIKPDDGIFTVGNVCHVCRSFKMVLLLTMVGIAAIDCFIAYCILVPSKA